VDFRGGVRLVGMDELSDLEYARLTAVLSGEGSADDHAWVERWAAIDAKNGMLLAHLTNAKMVLHASERDEMRARTDRLQRVFEEHRRTTRPPERDESRTVPVSSRTVARSRFRTPVFVAGTAAAVAVLAVAAGVFRNTPSGTEHSYTTRAREQSSITLPDGTRARLAPNTQLIVASGFGAQTRTVMLRGEAYFDVIPSTAATFIVETGNVTTRVLGTAFTVRHYDTDASVRVAVLDGKVTSGTRRASVTLAAGTVAQLTDSTATTVRDSDAGSATAWTKGRLEFDDEPVHTVLTTLGRWYGYTFRITDSSTAKQHVSATFRVAAPAEAISDLERMLGVTMTRRGDTITFRPRARHFSKPEAERPRARDTYSIPTEAGR
jgi:transmembrane sensor